VFLENANGNPGLSDSRPDSFAAGSPEVLASDCSFPFDESGKRYKGLPAAAGTITSEAACAAACCAAGDAAKCNVYQFYAVKSAGQTSQVSYPHLILTSSSPYPHLILT
jgi:hypothetical protein